jgi:hypothetical protein
MEGMISLSLGKCLKRRRMGKRCVHGPEWVEENWGVILLVRRRDKSRSKSRVIRKVVRSFSPRNGRV